jgi:hypothetical protein
VVGLPVYPQPAFQIPATEVPSSMTLLSNPCYIRLNDITIACTSHDVVQDLNNQEFRHPTSVYVILYFTTLCPFLSLFSNGWDDNHDTIDLIEVVIHSHVYHYIWYNNIVCIHYIQHHWVAPSIILILINFDYL